MNLVQLLVDSLALGSQYSLVALGIGLIFGVMRMINFAQGDLITFGAYMLVVPTVADVAPPMIAALPTPVLIAATIAVVALAALLTERLAFRSVRRKGADGPTLLITSFAIGYFIQSVILFLHTGPSKIRQRSAGAFTADYLCRRTRGAGRSGHDRCVAGVAVDGRPVPEPHPWRHCIAGSGRGFPDGAAHRREG